jgi:hypothetical protein
MADSSSEKSMISVDVSQDTKSAMVLLPSKTSIPSKYIVPHLRGCGGESKTASSHTLVECKVSVSRDYWRIERAKYFYFADRIGDAMGVVKRGAKKNWIRQLMLENYAEVKEWTCSRDHIAKANILDLWCDVFGAMLMTRVDSKADTASPRFLLFERNLRYHGLPITVSMTVDWKDMDSKPRKMELKAARDVTVRYNAPTVIRYVVVKPTSDSSQSPSQEPQTASSASSQPSQSLH